MKKIGEIFLLFNLIGLVVLPVNANSGDTTASGSGENGGVSFRLVSALGARHLDVEQIGGETGVERATPLKSPNRAFVSSLIIPGAGQLYLGSKRGYIYILAEVGMLAAYFVTRSDAENTRESYREHVRAHVAFEWPYQAAEQFEKWDPIEDYEHATLYDNWLNVYTKGNDGEPLERVGAWYWKDRQAFKDEERGEGNHDSPQREIAKTLRYEANDKFERARTFLGIVILNHVISAVEARISAIRSNRRYMAQAAPPRSFEFDVRTSVSPHAAETRLVLRKRF
ncbi:MAG: DUF5683 domain-containing protein [Candidatus Poribacteria bacterium]|nr:DUF5683 domain-containing protein [Candidatus Poribacteria bacterium]